MDVLANRQAFVDDVSNMIDEGFYQNNGIARNLVYFNFWYMTSTGDKDPLDICVVSERPITRAEVLLTAKVVGGLPMLDGGEADDKIIAVLKNDPFWADASDLSDLPTAIVERLRHYFLTYKSLPNNSVQVSIGAAYGRKHAEAVIQASINDYESKFGKTDSIVSTE